MKSKKIDLSRPRSRHEIVTTNGQVLTASAIVSIKPFSEVLCAPNLHCKSFICWATCRTKSFGYFFVLMVVLFRIY